MGAYTGDFVEAVLFMWGTLRGLSVKPGCRNLRIAAFEPNPRAFDLVTSRIRYLLRHSTNPSSTGIQVLPYALASETGRRTLHCPNLRSNDPSGEASLSPPLGTEPCAEGTVEVEVTTLDALFASPLFTPLDPPFTHIIKVSAGAHSYDVLKGGLGLLHAARVAFVLVAYDATAGAATEWRAADVAALLAETYFCFLVLPGLLVPVSGGELWWSPDFERELQGVATHVLCGLIAGEVLTSFVHSFVVPPLALEFALAALNAARTKSAQRNKGSSSVGSSWVNGHALASHVPLDGISSGDGIRRKVSRTLGMAMAMCTAAGLGCPVFPSSHTRRAGSGTTALRTLRRPGGGTRGLRTARTSRSPRPHSLRRGSCRCSRVAPPCATGGGCLGRSEQPGAMRSGRCSWGHSWGRPLCSTP